MGTPATTRIANEHDYIEHHTRWDGFPDEIIQYMKNLSLNWGNALDLFKEKITADSHGTVGLTEWASNFEQLLEKHEDAPTIETTSLLLCFLSFTHHHVLPHKAPNDLLSYWGEGEPDVTAQLVNGKVNYTKEEDNDQPEVNVTVKSIPDGFKVMRIYNLNKEGKLTEDDYVDFKYKDITEEDLFASILHLPLFLRDVYTLTKTTRTERKNKDYKDDSLTRLFQKIAEFYQPTSEYIRYGRDSHDKIRTLTERKKSISDSLDNADSMIPFDLYTSSLGNHIALANPGKVFPLTKGESLSEYTVSFKVAMFDNRLNSIYCNIPNKSEEEMLSLLNDVTLRFDFRMHRFNNYHKVDNISEQIEFLQLICEETYLGIHYEETLISLMENQYSIEMNNLLESNE
jgi:hypothetical protein